MSDRRFFPTALLIRREGTITATWQQLHASREQAEQIVRQRLVVYVGPRPFPAGMDWGWSPRSKKLPVTPVHLTWRGSWSQESGFHYCAKRRMDWPALPSGVQPVFVVSDTALRWLVELDLATDGYTLADYAEAEMDMPEVARWRGYT